MLTRTRARRLSRKGEHNAALKLSAGQDIEILSRAGMHLSVLRKSDAPSIYRAIALAHAGMPEKALETGLHFRRHHLARNLLGRLATMIPERVGGNLDTRPEWKYIDLYCKARVSASDLLLKELPKIPPPLAVYIAQKVGELNLAKTYFDKIFMDTELPVPTRCWNEYQLTIRSIYCDTDKSVIVKNGPLVSVVLTAHNEEAYLAIALRSLLQQSWRQLEIIVVDDGSTDQTFEIARSFQNTDGRVRAYQLDKNVGIWAAKNYGIGKSTGEYVTMHDADDWSHPYKIAEQMKPLLADKAIACSSSHFLRVDENTGQLFSRNADNFLRWNPSSLLFRTHLADKLGKFHAIGLGNDCEFVARIENRFGFKSHSRIRKPLSVGLWRKDGLSNKFREGNKALERLEHWEDWRMEHMAPGTNYQKCNWYDFAEKLARRLSLKFIRGT